MGDLLDMETQPATTIEEAMGKPKITWSMEVPSSSSRSLGLLKIYWDKKNLREEMTNEKSLANPSNTSNHREVSPACIMKMARVKLLQRASQNSDFFYTPSNVFNDSPGLSSEDKQDVELAMLLQASAEKVSLGEFDRAQWLLRMCGCGASQTGNPVQRVVFYFGEALQEKIDRATGLLSLAHANTNKLDAAKFLLVDPEALITTQNNLPFCPITDVTGMQSILDNVSSAKKIHLIDLSIQFGSHWTILLQALAERNECLVDLLKITAVGTSRPLLEWTGKHLLSFSQDKKVPFQVSFKAVESKITELSQDLFEVESGEVVVVYSCFCLGSLVASPNHLEELLSVIKSLKPCVMVVIEPEVSTSRSTFVERFHDYLIYASSIFDCFHACLGQDEHARKVGEEVFLRGMIKNVVEREGEEMHYHHETIDFWKAQLTRSGLVEAEFSPLSLYQASLILKKSTNWMHCNFGKKGKCLIINWKGVPVRSLSTWRFQV